MLEHYYLKAKTIDRIKLSWIADAIEQYVAWLEQHGHSVRTIHRRVPLLVRFGEFAKKRGAKNVEDLVAHVTDFTCYFERQPNVQGFERDVSYVAMFV
jgi:integrase/recombinase XerD